MEVYSPMNMNTVRVLGADNHSSQRWVVSSAQTGRQTSLSPPSSLPSPATLWSPRPALSSVRYHNTLFIPGRPDVKFITSPSTNIKSEIWIIDSLPKTYEMRSNAGIVMTRSKRQKFAYQGIRSGTQNIFYCERESWLRYHCLTMSLPFKYLNHKIEVFFVLSLLHKHPYQDRRTL